jgi:dihydrofolate synthase/folylpolyglutamate synthase
MSFDYFARQHVDIAVIEVGLGGRLDSTNIILPEVSVITNIGFDHTQFLGTTYEAIAKEKAGIIKSNIPVVIGETQQETKTTFLEIAKMNAAKIHFAEDFNSNYTTDLEGSYQKHNIKTATSALRVLGEKSFNVSEESIKKGLQNVIKNTGLKGRWQVLQLEPKVICDTAHNKEALTYIVKQLARENYNKLHVVFGVVNDKDVDSILPLLPKEATYYFCKPNVPRGLDAKILKYYFIREGFKGKTYNSVKMALDAAKMIANPEDLIYVGGSTFVVAEVV